MRGFFESIFAKYQRDFQKDALARNNVKKWKPGCGGVANGPVQAFDCHD